MRKIITRLKESNLAKDSFWAVWGNGLGQALLLLAGILIARQLGRDLYGEYGMVKTNMFYMAGLSTFGLAFTSTRYISKYLTSDRTQIKGIIKKVTKITLIFSSIIAGIIIVAAHELERFIGVQDVAQVFKVLSVIIILKALSGTSTGILAGLRRFRIIAQNSIISGLTLLILCIPFSYVWGLYGALAALTTSQIVNAVLNYREVYKESKQLPHNNCYKDSIKDLLQFTFPIALHEMSYSIFHWTGILMLTRLSSLGEVGLYSASAQWGAIIMMLPSLLTNVTLSHLSGRSGAQQHKLLYRLLLVYLICTFIPFFIVYIFTDLIISCYGTDFLMMKQVLRVTILASIPACCSNVFKSELIAIGRTWSLFLLRMLKDVVFLTAVWCLLISMNGYKGAYYYAMGGLFGEVAFFVGVFVVYRFSIRNSFNKDSLTA